MGIQRKFEKRRTSAHELQAHNELRLVLESSDMLLVFLQLL